jgi:D-beta-D-heptose 7-phosphate kinase/D-beta-D-heptose 1-phosphate adenosyltransferase
MIVFTNGCFDLLHAGHVDFLRRARALGDRLIVAINEDASVRSLKGPGRPVYSVGERVAMLAAIRSVDDVWTFGSEAELIEMIRILRPDVLAKGENSRRPIPGAEYAGAVELLPVLSGYSTTSIIERIARRGSACRLG